MQRCTLHVLCISLLFQVKLFCVLDVCTECIALDICYILEFNQYIHREAARIWKKEIGFDVCVRCVFFIKILWSERSSLSDICRTIPSKNGIPRIMAESCGDSTLLILDDYYIMHTPNVQTNRQLIYIWKMYSIIFCAIWKWDQ